ncbi:MAG: carbohydrate-binding family 9-like protein [Bacteroidota bacterium]
MIVNKLMLLNSLLIVLLLTGCGPGSQQEGTAGSSAEEPQEEAFATPKIPFDPHHYIAYRTDEPIRVDGRLDEEIWEQAPWTEEFGDIEGELQPDPHYRTRAKMLWDDEYFYYSAELEDPDLWSTYDERDLILWDENNFEIFIDPDGDTHNYWEFQINPIQTIFDIFMGKPYRDGGTYLMNWNLIDDDALVGVHLDGSLNDPESEDVGWTLEIALSWDALSEYLSGRNPPEAGDQWRVNFSRVQHDLRVVDGEYRRHEDPDTGQLRPERNWSWSPQGLVNMHYPEMWGYLQFSDHVAGEGTDEFVRDPDEDVKWALRQLYYKQQNHVRNHGSYSDDPEVLGVDSIEIEGIDFDPEIKTTMTQFEATFPGVNGDRIWHINQDGRVWSR